MILGAIISEQYTEKNQSYVTIYATFKPSPYESYKYLLKLNKQIQLKEWKMNDLYISNNYNQYESIMSLYFALPTKRRGSQSISNSTGSLITN